MDTLDENEDQAAVQRRKQAEIDKANVKHPQFDEILQMMLPSNSVCEDGYESHCEVVLTTLDKKENIIGMARVSMASLRVAPNLLVDGPFCTDTLAGEPTGWKIHGCIKLRWLTPSLEESF